MTRLASAALALALALAAPLAAQPPDSIDAKPLAISGPTTVAPYKIVRLSAQNVPVKAGVVWKVRAVGAADSTGLVDWATRQNVHDIGFVAPPGVYRAELSVGSVGADGAMALDYAEILVTIGAGPQPPPPPPSPGPTDPLTATFQAAYAADTGAQKATQIRALATVWRAAVASADDPAVKTAGDLLAAIHNVVQGQVGDGLTGVRKTVAAELNAKLPTTAGAPLDATLRAACKVQFARVATALEGVR